MLNKIIQLVPEEEQPTNWRKEFHKQYDFSESKTLEYDNLLTIESFIAKQIDKTKLERSVIHATKMSNLEQQITVLKADLKIERDLVKSLIK